MKGNIELAFKYGPINSCTAFEEIKKPVFPNGVLFDGRLAWQLNRMMAQTRQQFLFLEKKRNTII